MHWTVALKEAVDKSRLQDPLEDVWVCTGMYYMYYLIIHTPQQPSPQTIIKTFFLLLIKTPQLRPPVSQVALYRFVPVYSASQSKHVHLSDMMWQSCYCCGDLTAMEIRCVKNSPKNDHSIAICSIFIGHILGGTW